MLDDNEMQDPNTVPVDADAEPREHHPRRRAAFRPVGAPVHLAADFSAVEAASVAEPGATGASVALVTTRAVALFQPPPDVAALPPKPRTRSDVAGGGGSQESTDTAGESAEFGGDDDQEDDDTYESDAESDAESESESDEDASADSEGGEGTARRRRRRGGRRRRKPGGTEANSDSSTGQDSSRQAVRESDESGSFDDDNDSNEGTDGADSGSHRRRRRSREGAGDQNSGGDDPPDTVVHVRETRGNDQVTAVRGSTRLEAKKQRRREGREAVRRRPPILTESEFLARRDSVERRMIVRAVGDRTQVAVLEDGVLAEHYVSRNISASMLGNVYLGRVQNVLPSMEAAFVDIGRGRNAVLYAGEVNWQAAGLAGSPKRIELALKAGDPILVQVTKDPAGHKGARLTSQVSLAGRYLVFVPGSAMTGISRRLPDKERTRLKKLLREALPDGFGVIVRTAAEGASEEQIISDVTRLTADWRDIEAKSATAQAPELLHGEPDLAIRVVRDIFNEDFASLVVSGDVVAEQIETYVGAISPELRQRVSRWASPEDPFVASRIDEQLAKALDRKVWLPSGGSLVIDRTEAMTVVDVNTGKFTGSGGNLEETVTRNNLEAAEEIVRQLRLRDIGGIIVIDFIDMVLERNRDLVLRRLVECLGRDRTKHQVAEVTSLGLVQMTRKRIGQGLLESFSEACDVCNGRGIRISTHPVDRPFDAETTPRRRAKPPGPIPGAPTPSSQVHASETVVEETGVEDAAVDQPVSDAEGDQVGDVVDELVDSDDASLDAADLVDIEGDLDDLELDESDDDESDDDDDDDEPDDDESDDDDEPDDDDDDDLELDESDDDDDDDDDDDEPEGDHQHWGQ